MELYEEEMNELCSITEYLKNDRLITLSKFLRQRINNPDTYLVFLGETCSGKSTLINSVIGKNILPVSGVPSTGAITEISFDGTAEQDSYFAINKDASMEMIDKDVFESLSLKPDADLERLRYSTNRKNANYNGVKIFDTPGYGSLIKQHGEVLTEFLPNADAIVYIVSYRIGFQEEDYDFLKGLMNLTREGVPFYLIINRCPCKTSLNDRRVQEIYRYVTSLLQKTKIPLTILESFVDEDESSLEKPMQSFMNTVMRELNSDIRRNELKEAFGGYIKELIAQTKAEVERLIRNRQYSDEQKQGQEESLNKILEKLEDADSKIIKPGFKKIRDKFPVILEESRERIEHETLNAIDAQSKMSKEETTAYIRMHVLNFNAQKEVKELQFYLENELSALDEKVNDYLNTAIVEFEADLRLKSPGATYEAGINIMKGFGNKFLNAGLLKYFAKFGGAGGSSAGIANAASHALKKLGDFFGKTFSKETHNALKHTLKVLGLTSTKVLAASAASFIELVSFAIEYNIWQNRLKKQVIKTTHDWADELQSVVTEDLKKLEWENVKNIREISEELQQTFSTEEDEWEFDIDELQIKMERLVEIERMVV